MIAEATLTAHFIAAALKSGMTQDEINAVLIQMARDTVISEFWVSDENGFIEFTSRPDIEFRYPTDSNAGTQAAPFVDILLGNETVVVQEFLPREYDEAVFKYVAVVGVDQARIVQVGIAEPQ